MFLFQPLALQHHPQPIHSVPFVPTLVTNQEILGSSYIVAKPAGITTMRLPRKIFQAVVVSRGPSAALMSKPIVTVPVRVVRPVVTFVRGVV